MQITQPKRGWPYISRQVLAGLVIFLGIIVLVGWAFDIISFRRFLPRLVSMNPFTAICFILEGFALLNISVKIGRLYLSVLPCILVCIITLLKLTIFIPALTVRVDSFLFADSQMDNRMSVITALNLLACAMSLILLSRRSSKAIAAGQALGLMVFLVALSAVLGYMYNIRSLYTVDIFFPVAFHTAMCLLFLSLGIFLARHRDGFMQVISARLLGGSLTRRMLPLAVIIPLLLEWLRFEAREAGIVSENLSIAIDNILIIFIISIALWVYARSLNLFDAYRQKAEKDLIISKNAADEARKSQELFLANMSHEIRTPMNGVIGMTSLLQRTHLDEEQKSFVETIRISGESLLVIINDILDFSKIEAGKLHLEEEGFMVKNVVEETFDILSTAAANKNLKLISHIDSHVPKYILGDITRLRQILVNLVSNGIKFTKQGEIRVEVSVHYGRAAGQEIEFKVTDTGMGIPADKLDKLFQAFSQVDPGITRKYGGTGLGLAICHGLVQMMGGKIGVESAPGSGSAFYFALPLRPAAHIKAESSTAQPGIVSPLNPAEDTTGHKTLRVLIAEDNALNIRMALKMLSGFGYTADVAGNGLEAIEAVKRQQYDMILMDVVMPEMDGLIATAHIRAMPLEHQPVIIVLTANAIHDNVEKYIGSGANDYLLKPFKVADLESMIMKWG